MNQKEINYYGETSEQSQCGFLYGGHNFVFSNSWCTTKTYTQPDLLWFYIGKCKKCNYEACVFLIGDQIRHRKKLKGDEHMRDSSFLIHKDKFTIFVDGFISAYNRFDNYKG